MLFFNYDFHFILSFFLFKQWWMFLIKYGFSESLKRNYLYYLVSIWSNLHIYSHKGLNIVLYFRIWHKNAHIEIKMITSKLLTIATLVLLDSNNLIYLKYHKIWLKMFHLHLPPNWCFKFEFTGSTWLGMSFWKISYEHWSRLVLNGKKNGQN